MYLDALAIQLDLFMFMGVYFLCLRRYFFNAALPPTGFLGT